MHHVHPRGFWGFWLRSGVSLPSHGTDLCADVGRREGSDQSSRPGLCSAAPSITGVPRSTCAGRQRRTINGSSSIAAAMVFRLYFLFNTVSHATSDACHASSHICCTGTDVLRLPEI